jgi:hypothetical protein
MRKSYWLVSTHPGERLFMLDVLITGGEIHDGAGTPPVRTDVGIAGDRVAWIRPPGPDAPAEGASIRTSA